MKLIRGPTSGPSFLGQAPRGHEPSIIHFLRVSFALSRLLEKVSSTSWRSGAPAVKSSGLPYCPAPCRSDAPGTDAMCRASWPEKRIPGGVFQASLSSGIRSRLASSFVLPIQLHQDRIHNSHDGLLSSPFERNSFTTSAVNPPADIKTSGHQPALAMQNGHTVLPPAASPFTANAWLRTFSAGPHGYAPSLS